MMEFHNTGEISDQLYLNSDKVSIYGTSNGNKSRGKWM